MGRLFADTDNIAAATRGLIIQRVIVDGWEPKRAAAAFGVGEQEIVRGRRGCRRLADGAAGGPDGGWPRRAADAGAATRRRARSRSWRRRSRRDQPARSPRKNRNPGGRPRAGAPA